MCSTLGLRFALVLFASVICLFGQSENENFRKLREDMVRTQLATPDWGVDAVHDPLVLDAFRQVPRHRFVPDALVPHAY